MSESTFSVQWQIGAEDFDSLTETPRAYFHIEPWEPDLEPLISTDGLDEGGLRLEILQRARDQLPLFDELFEALIKLNRLAAPPDGVTKLRWMTEGLASDRVLSGADTRLLGGATGYLTYTDYRGELDDVFRPEDLTAMKQLNLVAEFEPNRFQLAKEEEVEQAVSEPPPPYKPFPNFDDWSAPSDRDKVLWKNFASLLQGTKKRATDADFEAAVAVINRATAVDTAAIEGLYPTDRGFTMSVAHQTMRLEEAFKVKGAKAKSSFEDLVRALDYVLDAATNRVPVTQNWIRELHATACASQETYEVWTGQGRQERPLHKGEYKKFPNNPQRQDGSTHSYAPVIDVQPELDRLVEQLSSEPFETAHPAAQAAYAHYCLVAIHPFADGNGRVARLVASTYFYRAESIPLTIFVDQKEAYLAALEKADNGDSQDFVGFCAERAIDTISLVHETMKAAAGPPIKDLAARFHRLYGTVYGLDQSEIEVIGDRLAQQTIGEIEAHFRQLGLPKEVVLAVTEARDSVGAPEGYRRLVQAQKAVRFNVTVTSSQPATASTNYQLRVLLATSGGANPYAFAIERHPGSGEHLLARVEEVHPREGPSFAFRRDVWVERFLRDLLEQNSSAGEEFLKRNY